MGRPPFYITEPCVAVPERCACRKAAGRACPAPTPKPPLSKGGAERSEAEGFLAVRRCDGQPGKARRNPSVRLRRPPPFDKGGSDCRKRRIPLGPLCEGAPPAGGGGENCAVARLFIVRPAALRGCPCTVCLPQGCGPGMPGPYVLRGAGLSFWHIFSSFLLFWNIFRLFCTNRLLFRFLLYYND